MIVSPGGQQRVVDGGVGLRARRAAGRWRARRRTAPWRGRSRAARRCRRTRSRRSSARRDSPRRTCWLARCPAHSSTARGTKFSEAISSSVSCWRSSSSASTSAIWGSTSASGRRGEVGGWFFGHRLTSLSARARLAAGCTRPGAGSASCRCVSSSLRSTIVEGVPGSSPASSTRSAPARISGGTCSSVRASALAGEVRARQQQRPVDVERRDRRARRAARRRRAGSDAAGLGTSSVSGPGSSATNAARVRGAELGQRRERHLHRGKRDRRGLAGGPSLQREQPRHRGRVLDVRADPVDGVGGDHGDAAGRDHRTEARRCAQRRATSARTIRARSRWWATSA